MRSSRSSFPLHLALLLLAGACSDSLYPSGPDGPTQVDIVFCAETVPAWVVFQDGDGAWTRVKPDFGERNATMHLSLRNARGGVAIARDHASGISSLFVQYGTARELANAGDPDLSLCGATADRTLAGQVVGLAADELAVVSANRSTREVVALTQGGKDFTLGSVSSGPQEILVTRLKNVNDLAELTGFILRHSTDLPNDSIPPLDFTSSEVLLPVTPQLTLVGLGDGAISRSGIRTQRSPDRITSGSEIVTSATRAYTAAPEALLGPGDLQFINAQTTISNTSNVARSVTAYFRTPVNRTLTFGAVPVAPTIVSLSSPGSVRFRATFPEQGDYDAATTISYQQGQSLAVSVSMTRAYEQLAGVSYDLVIPDFQGIEGFQARWLLQPGSLILWTTSRVGGLPITATPASESIRRIATDAGFLTP